MVGDPNQNIYSFNNTINGFEELKGKGELKALTASFRVAPRIAKAVEGFANDTFNAKMDFSGTPSEDSTITSKAYIARYNAALVEKIIQCNATNTPYNLVRPAKALFDLPLTLVGLRKGGFVSNPEYKHLQNDVEDYYKDKHLQSVYPSPLAYVRKLYENDIKISSALRLVSKHGVSGLMEAKKVAEEYQKSRKTYDLTICSSHSSKGLEFDEVELGNDLNQVVSDIMTNTKDTWSAQDYEELRLYYVAATRARKSLVNDTILTKYYEKDADYGFNLL